MRRILLVLLFAALVASSGCLTPEAKSQWHNAVGDLSGANTKSIAPLSTSTKKSE